MLIQLDIENIAVIERAYVEFESGLNVITGETGSGKSLLINSLNMVLGSRTAKDLISEGADYSKVSAVFYYDGIDALLEEMGIPTDDGNIVLTRKLYRDGRNICHINSSPVNVSTLRTVGEKLLVIHGQSDNAVLSDTSSHVHFLDAFSKSEELLKEYKSVYKNLKDVTRALDTLKSDALSRQNEINYLSYQVDEIEKASLSESEELELIERKVLLENAESLSAHSKEAHAALSGECGVHELMYGVKRALEKLAEIDESASSYSDKATDLYYEAEELSNDVSAYLSKIEFNPSELFEINERLDTINTLKRKYNGEIKDILSFYEEAVQKLSFLRSYDENKKELEDSYNNLFEKATLIAKSLSSARKKSAALLSEKLCEELSSLDMPSCTVEFSFTPVSLCENGLETVELLISTNPAEKPKSLSKIASGGEISRVMLAVKSVFSDFDKIPTLLFDEIDTGVSGRAAEKIAKKMRFLSKRSQLICVTHLPIIASFATHHLLLEKNTSGDAFKTTVRPICGNERVREIARIISGDSINEVALENASSMLENAKEEKG